MDGEGMETGHGDGRGGAGLAELGGTGIISIPMELTTVCHYK